MARIRRVLARLRSRTPIVPPEILALKPVLERDWPTHLRELRASGVPLAAEGDGDGGDGDGDGDAGDGSGDGDGDGSGDGDGDGSGSGSGDPDWKRESRKHERRAKSEKKRADELAEKLKKIEEGNASEAEKAIAKAKEEAKAEALEESSKERRADRLEVATTRAATQGIEIEVEEDGETKTEKVKFADPDDALTYVERAIRKGDVDEDDIFDDEGKVQTDALKSALGDILEEKPHLRAGAAESNGGGERKRGSGDGGKGSGSGKSLEDLSPADHDKHLRSGRNK